MDNHAYTSSTAPDSATVSENGKNRDKKNNGFEIDDARENNSVSVIGSINAGDGPGFSNRNMCGSLVGVVRRNVLLVLVLAGAILGFCLGIGIRYLNPSESALIWIGLPGEIFLRSLKCTIIPLIVASIISGTATLDPKSNKRITWTAVAYILVANSVGVLTGVAMYFIIRPAEFAQGSLQASEQTTKTVRLDTEDIFVDMIRNFFPDNVITACFQKTQTQYVPAQKQSQNSSTVIYERRVGTSSSSNVLGILIICAVVGLATSKMGEAGRPFVLFFKAASDIIIIAITWVIWLTPIGVTSLISVSVAGTASVAAIFEGMGMFTLTLFLSIVTINCIFVPLCYLLIIRKNPLYFLGTSVRPIMAGFGACSSAVAIPELINTAENKHGVEPRLARFCALLNSSISRSGSGAFIFMCSLFLATLENSHLDSGQVVYVIILSVAGTLAVPAVPSSSIICILIILSSLDIQPQNIGVVMALEWLLDRTRTTSNIMCSLLGTVLVNRFVSSNVDNDECVMGELAQ